MMNKAELKNLRNFYSPYEEMLANKLREENIELLPNSIKYINADGRPVFPTSQKYIFDLVPLRPNEYVLYAIKAKGVGVYAFPDNGIGLRYLKLGTNIHRMKSLKKFSNKGILAAVSDGSNIYALTEEGKVIHNNFNLTEEIRIFDKVEFCESIWKQNIDISTVEEYIKTNYKDDVIDLDKGNDCYYYDTEKRTFFWHIERGGYHDPIEMTNIRLTKRQMLERLVNTPQFNIKKYSEACKSGEISMFAVACLLEEDKTLADYQPPKRFRE